MNAWCLTCGSITRTPKRGRCPACHTAHHRQTAYTPAYRRARKLTIEAANGQCTQCGSTNHMTTHHTTYGPTANQTLIALCAACHNRTSGRHGHRHA